MAVSTKTPEALDPPATGEAAAEIPRHPELLFKVAAVERIQAPSGSGDDPWYRYVVANQVTTITGQRRGSKEAVMEHAKSFVERLNSRVEPRKGAPWTTR